MTELGCVKDWSLDLSKFGQARPEPAGLGSAHKPLWIGPGHIFSVKKILILAQLEIFILIIFY
jgi:hypothetical protein